MSVGNLVAEKYRRTGSLQDKNSTKRRYALGPTSDKLERTAPRSGGGGNRTPSVPIGSSKLGVKINSLGSNKISKIKPM
jgi:hypothetical protein